MSHKERRNVNGFRGNNREYIDFLEKLVQQLSTFVIYCRRYHDTHPVTAPPPLPAVSQHSSSSQQQHLQHQQRANDSRSVLEGITSNLCNVAGSIGRRQKELDAFLAQIPIAEQ